MKTRLHLVSMPFARTTSPSIQVGGLKAWVEREFSHQIPVHPYSAHFSVVVHETRDAAGFRDNPLFDGVDGLESTILRSTGNGRFEVEGLSRTGAGELPYFFLYLRRYLPGVLDASREQLGLELLERVEPGAKSLVDSCTRKDFLDILEQRTQHYLDEKLLPALHAGELNVVGFSCTFSQTYASAYALKYVREKRPEVPLLFVFGGCSMGMPTTAAVLRKLELDALGVIGEGERKLARILRACLDASPEDSKRLSATVRGDGIVHLADDYDCYGRKGWLKDEQLKSLDVLPCPDYDEFFSELRGKCADADEVEACTAQVELPLEGSRGCAFACTFCNLNHLWDGYRTLHPDVIVDNTLELMRRSPPGLMVRFVDNLCNWAPRFADELITLERKVPCFLELRARYGEDFWARLAEIGVSAVQVGVEALSTSMLELMEKKARALDNLRALKFMAERGVRHNSNLIIQYPGSTLDQVRQTRAMMEHVVHLPLLAPVEFVLTEGSPLYNRLSLETKQRLNPGFNIFYRPSVRPLVVDYLFAIPPELELPPEVREGWEALKQWYVTTHRQGARFTIRREGAAVVVDDTRFGREGVRRFEGHAARALDACHAGLKPEDLAQALGLDVAQTAAVVAPLLAERLLLDIDGHLLNLALRPSDELQAARRPVVLRSAAAARAPGALAEPTAG